MGRGIAKRVADVLPEVQLEFGRQIKTHNLTEYNLLLYPEPYGATRLGAFQVKYKYNESADVDLISRSIVQLNILACGWQDARFDLNYPGIGNGRLSKRDVIVLIEYLPDNVHIWTFE